VIEKAWASVAIEAGDLVMGGCLPRINIFLHIVAETTEGRAFRKSENGYKEEEQKKKKRTVECLLFPFGKPWEYLGRKAE
jgi:hypothetical protein